MAQDSLSQAEELRLERGEVIIHTPRLDDNGGTVRVWALVHAPAKAVWDVIVDCDQNRYFVVGLEHCEVLVDEPERALTHHVVDAGFFTPELDFRFEARRQPFSRMDFRLTEGNLRRMEGYWRFTPRGEAVLIEHELSLQPAVPAPRWLVRRKLASDLPAMLACIRWLAGGSEDPKMQASDRDACFIEPAARGQ